MNPSRTEYSTGTNRHGQEVILVHVGNTWTICKMAANQRDDNQAFEISEGQLRLIAHHFLEKNNDQ